MDHLFIKLLAATSSRELVAVAVEGIRSEIPWEAVAASAVVDRGATQRRILVVDHRADGSRVPEDGVGVEGDATALFRRILNSDGVLFRSEAEISANSYKSFGDRGRLSQSLVGVPLALPGGKPFATLALHSYIPAAYDETHLERLRELARQIAPPLHYHLSGEKLRRDHDFFRRAMQQIRAVTYERDYRSGRYLAIGAGMAEMIGYPDDEIGPDLWKRATIETILLHEPPGITVEQAIQRALAGITTGWRAEVRVRTASGDERWVLDSAVTLYDFDGKPKGSIGILQDITKAKQATQVRDLLACITPAIAAASTSREMGRIVLNGIRRLVPWDAAYLVVSSATSGLFRVAYLVDTNTDGEEREFVEEYQRFFEPNSSESEKAGQAVLRVRSADGSMQDTTGINLPPIGFTDRKSRSIIFAPMKVSNDRLVGVMSVQSYQDKPYTSEDLEVVRLCAAHCADALGRALAEEEQARLRQRVQLAEKLESLGVLAGGIAHDFNNLLASVFGNVGLLQLDHPPGSAVHESVSQIEHAAKRMRDLTRQMLSFAGRVEFAPQVINLHELLADLRDLGRVSLSHEHPIQWEDRSAGCTLRGDAAQIKQAILNLLRNAVEASTDKRGPIVVRFSLREIGIGDLQLMQPHPPPQAGHYLTVEVIDKGSGMAPGVLPRITEPFFSTRFQGRGLGLSTAKGIMDAHRGGLTAESRANVGSTVTLLFPAEPAPASSIPRHQGHSKPIVPVLPNRPDARLLVVDDEPIVLDLACRLVTRLGLQPVKAATGTEAIELLQQSGDTIVGGLLDYTLPDMTGAELVASIRQFQPAMPIVIMSGIPPAALRSRTPVLQAQDFLQKPFQLNDLANILRRVLGDTTSPVGGER